jgi:hypothetical protein
MWKFLNFLHPDYQDYIEGHLREIIEHYGRDVDGFFVDIVFFARDACWSEPSVAFRKKHGLLENTRKNFEIFQGLAQAQFAARFTKLIRSLAPQASIFYNAQNEGSMDPRVGPRARQAMQTHCEIESLPSGFWGYHHFPRMARAQSTWGKPWLAMTGRFQKMWGDFGGLKPQVALEYECFRSQALGGGNSVGDQLPPRGRLDAGAYDLIGAVYQQVKNAEPFYEGAKFLDERVGIFSASFPGIDGGKSEEGVVVLCEEAHYDCVMLDSRDDFEKCTAVILPDSTVVDKKLAARLRAYHSKGGKILLSHHAGRDEGGKFMLDFLGLKFEDDCDLHPTYWRARAGFDKAMARSDRVFYAAGANVRPGKGASVLVDRVLPYFKRSDMKYSSHFQTPPVAKVSGWPAVVAGERFVYFADPIFSEYRQTGNLAVRDVFRRLMRELVGAPKIGDGLPNSVGVYPLRKGADLLITLLHYVPVRKALDIDVIDEPSTFAGEKLRADGAKCVVDFETGEELPKNSDGSFDLPHKKGRLLLKVPGYFSHKRVR